VYRRHLRLNGIAEAKPDNSRSTNLKHPSCSRDDGTDPITAGAGGGGVRPGRTRCRRGDTRRIGGTQLHAGSYRAGEAGPNSHDGGLTTGVTLKIGKGTDRGSIVEIDCSCQQRGDESGARLIEGLESDRGVGNTPIIK